MLKEFHFPPGLRKVVQSGHLSAGFMTPNGVFELCASQRMPVVPMNGLAVAINEDTGAVIDAASLRRNATDPVVASAYANACIASVSVDGALSYIVAADQHHLSSLINGLPSNAIVEPIPTTVALRAPDAQPHQLTVIETKSGPQGFLADSSVSMQSAVGRYTQKEGSFTFNRDIEPRPAPLHMMGCTCASCVMNGVNTKTEELLRLPKKTLQARLENNGFVSMTVARDGILQAVHGPSREAYDLAVRMAFQGLDERRMVPINGPIRSAAYDPAASLEGKIAILATPKGMEAVGPFLPEVGELIVDRYTQDLAQHHEMDAEQINPIWLDARPAVPQVAPEPLKNDLEYTI